MQLTKNFFLSEFVPKEIYQQFGDKSIWFVDPDMVKLAQEMRDYFGVEITVNNWFDGGPYNNSGFRTPECTEGAKLSQHRFKCAHDYKLKGLTPDEVRNEIRKKFAHFRDFGLTTIESDTPTWVHCDKRNTGLQTLLEVPFQ